MKYKKEDALNKKDLEEDELEIESLLKSFQGEEIRIPEKRLEIGLQECLNKLQRPKKHYLAKVATTISIVLLAGTLMIPRVQVFAKEVIQSIFKDRGIENAVAAGYPAIPEVEGNIGDYKVRLFNIYIDAMRLTFEAEVIGLPEKDETTSQELNYILNIDDDWSGEGKQAEEVCIGTSSFNHGQVASIEIQGSGVEKLLAQDEIQIPLNLESSKYSATGKNGWTLIGSTVFNLAIPEEFHKPPKIYNVDEVVPMKGGKISFGQLKVSPTMMTLNYESDIEGICLTGLRDMKLVGVDKVYNEEISTSGGYDEAGGVTEYMMPSIYFEEGKQFRLEAKGYTYKKNELEKFMIEAGETLPKEIIYDGVPLEISKLYYQGGILEVGIRDKMPKKHNLGSIYINGIANQGMNIRTSHANSDDYSEQEEREYIVKIKVPESEAYELSLDFVLQKEEPIVIPINLK